MIRSFTLIAAVVLVASTALKAASWEDVAGRFGCNSKVHASEQAGGTQYIMEFVPQGQKLGTHERMFTITLVRTSQDDAEANRHVDQVIKSMAGVTGRSGAKVVEFTGYKGNHGPTAYFEFILEGEYNIGVIQRSGPGMIAIQQLATFGGRTPSEADRAAVKTMVGLRPAL